jgi:obg-like ATPase 1
LENQKKIETLNSFGLFTAKPMIFLLNTSEDQYFSENFPGKKLLEEWMQMKELPFEVIPYCGEIEDMVVSMGDAAASWIEENKFTSALPKIIKS